MAERPLDDRAGNDASPGDDQLENSDPQERSSTSDLDDQLPKWAGSPERPARRSMVTAVPATTPPAEPRHPDPKRPAPEHRAGQGTDDDRADVRPVDRGLLAADPVDPPLPVGDEPAERRRRIFPIIAAVLAGLLALGAVYLLGFAAGSDSSSDDVADGADPASPATQPAESEVDSPAANGGGDRGDGETDQTDGTEPTAVVAGDSTALKLTLEDYRFTVEGVVPSEETKEAIETRMGLVFAEFGSSNIVVDPSVAPAPWLDGAASLVNTMVLLHDGSIDITDQEVAVSGRALQSDFEKLQGALSADNGFPPFTAGEQEIVDKPAPMVRAVASGDTVTLTGELADEMMQSTIVEGARAIYGPANVVDETVVNPDRHNRFLIMRFPSNMAAYRVFGEYDIRGENESFTAILESGLVFDVAETELTDESRERLAGVMFTLTRNPLPVTVTGHTDSVGSSADNQRLSDQRAASVADFLIESGVLPENIVQIEGKGETEPVTENTTVEGRARNRRVEIIIGLYNE